jgi:hypothetical protein
MSRERPVRSEYESRPYTPKPLPSSQIKTPRGVGINEAEGSARGKRVSLWRRFVNRGERLVEVDSVFRETR